MLLYSGDCWSARLRQGFAESIVLDMQQAIAGLSAICANAYHLLGALAFWAQASLFVLGSASFERCSVESSKISRAIFKRRQLRPLPYPTGVLHTGLARRHGMLVTRTLELHIRFGSHIESLAYASVMD